MTTRRLRPTSAPDLDAAMDAIRCELDLPIAFPPDVEEAARAAATTPRLPDEDRSDLALVTLDPSGAMDLDQALHVERVGDGYRVHYAIADVAAFVAPGDPVDLEAQRRGETLYGADRKIPLHPPVLSEGAASLLPGELRPAVLWTIDLDGSGATVAVDVRRARVRSRGRYDYDGVQRAIDAGAAEPMWEVLRAVGELRMQRERARGGVSLPLPEQEIRVEDGRWTLAFRTRHPVEDWNEQLSLLTGMAAADLMLRGGVGLLRTLPAPDPRAIARLRRSAQALGIDWPPQRSYPDFIRSLDPADPHHVAMMTACTVVLRGAAYLAFDGQAPAPDLARHAALATAYAHVTAPLRRLADRTASELCLALCAGTPVPDWARAALPGLPAIMQASARRAGRYERAVLDLAEAATLAPRVGETFDGAVVEIDGRDPRKGEIMLADPAILAPIAGAQPLPLGERVRARLAVADPAARTLRFERLPEA